MVMTLNTMDALSVTATIRKETGMTQENYSDRMKDYGRTDIKGSGARKVAPIVINLPQDDSGAWMRDELTRYATEGRMSISALGKKSTYPICRSE